MLTRRKLLLSCGCIPFYGLLIGCEENSKPASLHPKPVVLDDGDECALCGMLIKRFPGPKGEALDGQGAALKFCSTRELFSWWFQPENQYAGFQLFVHDMAVTDWESPSDDAFIDARNAWYVSGSSRQGSMGTALASFATETDALRFRKTYGGVAIPFARLDYETIAKPKT